MARIFLDTNAFIDLNEGRDRKLIDFLANHNLYVSVVSLGIWIYIYKHAVPDDKFEHLFETFNFVETSSVIARRSFLGPTSDFEDNMQLHSASEAGCDTFITKDAKLIKLGYFGKVRICDVL